MTTIDLRSDAWFGDRSYRLEIPRDWELTTLGPRHLSPLTPEQIRTAVRRPTSSPPLSALARTRNRAGIILDDLSRPTPTADLLPAILDELAGGGLGPDSVTVVIAVGAHAAADDSQIRRKLGSDWYGRLRVVPHECRGGLRDLGKSSRGTPIHVNRHLMDCDLKIGVGGIYPHASAGFSGGGKIVLPGVCGIESARSMHQQLRGSPARGDLIDGEQRRDIEEVARRVGLSFIVNAVLDGDRRIAGVFAGDPQQAFREGVRFASDHLAIRDDAALRTADVVIADTYPFDTTLQFAVSKAIWPLLRADPDSVPVALAVCPAGIGHHELASIQLPLALRALRRLRHLRARELARVPTHARLLQRKIRRRRLPILLLHTGITTTELSRSFPRGRAFDSWSALCDVIRERRPTGPLRTVLYRNAPLLFSLDEVDRTRSPGLVAHRR